MVATRESLLTASAVKLYGRVITGLNIDVEGARNELGANQFLREQLAVGRASAPRAHLRLQLLRPLHGAGSTGHLPGSRQGRSRVPESAQRDTERGRCSGKPSGQACDRPGTGTGASGDPQCGARFHAPGQLGALQPGAELGRFLRSGGQVLRVLVRYARVGVRSRRLLTPTGHRQRTIGAHPGRRGAGRRRHDAVLPWAAYEDARPERVMCSKADQGSPARRRPVR